MPDERRGCEVKRAWLQGYKGVTARLQGRGCKVAKGVVNIVHKMLGNFEVKVQIRVGGLPPIS